MYALTFPQPSYVLLRKKKAFVLNTFIYMIKSTNRMNGILPFFFYNLMIKSLGFLKRIKSCVIIFILVGLLNNIKN